MSCGLFDPCSRNACGINTHSQLSCEIRMNASERITGSAFPFSLSRVGVGLFLEGVSDGHIVKIVSPFLLCRERLVYSMGTWALGLGFVATSTIMWLLVLLWALLPQSVCF